MPVLDPTLPCSECLSLFAGTILQPGPTVTVEQLEQRDREAREAMRRQAEPTRRRNQRCWLCEERRTCTLVSGEWECDRCQVVA